MSASGTAKTAGGSAPAPPVGSAPSAQAAAPSAASANDPPMPTDAYGQQLFDYEGYYDGQARPPQPGQQEYNDYVNLLFKDGGADDERRQAASAQAAHAHHQAQAHAQQGLPYYATAAPGYYAGAGGYYAATEGGYGPMMYPPQAYADYYYQGGQDYYVHDERAYQQQLREYETLSPHYAEAEEGETEGEGEEAHAQTLAKRAAAQALPLDMEAEGEEGELYRQLEGLSLDGSKRSSRGGNGRRAANAAPAPPLPAGPAYYGAGAPSAAAYRSGPRSWADMVKDGQSPTGGAAASQPPMPMMMPGMMMPPGMMAVPPHLAFPYGAPGKGMRYAGQITPAFPTPSSRGSGRGRSGSRGSRAGVYGSARGASSGYGRDRDGRRDGTLGREGGESLAANVHRRRGQTENGPVLPSQLGLAHLASINPPPSAHDNTPLAARFFVIKSYSEDDVHKALKYQIWTSTDTGNKRLDRAYRDQQALNPPAPVYLFFSVNASGKFCGVAEMTSALDFNAKSNVWNQTDKWTGQFSISWIYVKDVPNGQFRHIRLANNDNKPVTNSRDTQEVPSKQGREVLKIFSQYQLKSSVLDDWEYYNQAEEQQLKAKAAAAAAAAANSTNAVSAAPAAAPEANATANSTQ